MEQLLDENIYVIDLWNINTTPEIIFELSSILDRDEAKNRRICLKLGNVDLNQAQILSIKSLINGIDSTLSSIDTKSVETEKVALSLGIIVSNVSAENALEVNPEMPYKMAEELKEENKEENREEDSQENKQELIYSTEQLEEQEVQQAAQENNYDDNYNIVEEEDLSDNTKETEPQNNSSEQTEPEAQQNEQPQEETQGETAAAEVQEANNEQKNELHDELDVIFGSGASQPSIFDMEQPSQLYEEREELSDIVVPEQEYTKEDIELEAFPTKYIKQTMRSGQVINYEGNVVIIGDCHPGSEITAFGDITVWGVLSGIAHAGSGGNQKAKVRALKMNAIQLRIANCYSRRPDSLNAVYIEKTNSFTPEEARIINGEIVVFKMND